MMWEGRREPRFSAAGRLGSGSCTTRLDLGSARCRAESSPSTRAYALRTPPRAVAAGRPRPPRRSARGRANSLRAAREGYMTQRIEKRGVRAPILLINKKVYELQSILDNSKQTNEK